MTKEIEIPEGYESRIEGNKVVFELKESEDERIRRMIVNTLRDAVLSERISETSYREMLDYLEKQKEQKAAEGTAVQKAFVNSKIDYTLEEKYDASDYAETILPTSVTYGENEEEHKLHKIIEAAFIAGQKKEQKLTKLSEEDKYILKNIHYFVKENTIIPNRVNCAEECLNWINALPERFNL